MHINPFLFFKKLFSYRIVQTLMMVFISTIIALLIGEVVIYSLYKDSIVLFPRYVTDVQYNDFRIRRNVPNAHYWHKSVDGEWEFTINSRGFRDLREFKYRKSPDVVRVLVLGDSFTAGYEVRQDKTYASILERYLKKNGLNAEVINAGMSGNSNAEELVFFEQEGVKYQPDVVILGFFANDLIDNRRANLYRLGDNNHLVLHKKEYLPAIGIRNFLNSFWFYRWLSENSYLHNYLSNVATQFFKKRLFEKNQSSKKTDKAQSSSTIEEYNKRLAIALVKRIYTIAQEHNAYFILLDIAHFFNIKPSFPQREDYGYNKVADVYVNSAEFLIEYHKLIDLYQPHGHHHWTEFSHAIAGVQIGKIIRGKFEPTFRTPISEK